MNTHSISRPALSRSRGSYARKLGFLLALAIIGQMAIVTASADAAAARWWLRNSNSAGPSNISFDYGCWACTQTPVVGDWDNNGSDTPGMFDTAGGSPANWYLRNSNSGGGHDIFREYGSASGKPVVGDWRCEGDQTNVYVDGTWYLRRASGATEVQHLGSAYTNPLLGNSIFYQAQSYWCDTTAVHNPFNGYWTWEAGGSSRIWNFYYGPSGTVGLMGDWDGDNVDSPGVYVPSTSTFYLADDVDWVPPAVSVWTPPTPTQYSFTYGAPNAGSYPVVGDWNNDGVDTIGLVNAAS